MGNDIGNDVFRSFAITSNRMTLAEQFSKKPSSEFKLTPQDLTKAASLFESIIKHGNLNPEDGGFGQKIQAEADMAKIFAKSPELRAADGDASTLSLQDVEAFMQNPSSPIQLPENTQFSDI